MTLVSQVGLRLTWRGPGWPRLRAGSPVLGPPPSGMFLARGFWSDVMCTLPSPGPARGPGHTALEMPGSHAWGPVPPASSLTARCAVCVLRPPCRCLRKWGYLCQKHRAGTEGRPAQTAGRAPRSAQLPPRPGSAPSAPQRLLGGEEPCVQPLFKLPLQGGTWASLCSDLLMQLRSHLSCPERVKVWRLCFSLKMVIFLLSTLLTHRPGAPVLRALLGPCVWWGGPGAQQAALQGRHNFCTQARWTGPPSLKALGRRAQQDGPRRPSGGSWAGPGTRPSSSAVWEQLRLR